MPEVLADADPDPDPEAGWNGPQAVTLGEEAALVEQAVGRQEELSMHVPQLTVLEQAGRDEQPVVGRLLDERDDRRQAVGGPRQIGEARIVQAHGDLGRQVLQLVAGQAELGEDDQVGSLRAGLLEQLVMALQVCFERPQSRGDLGERDPQRSHALEHTRSPRPGVAIGACGC
jgi:hypothetical protein